MRGYVYVLATPDRCKIGRTGNFAQRMRTITCNAQIPISVVNVIQVERSEKCESALHRHFKQYRIRGEWFRLDEDQMDWLSSIREYDIHQLESYHINAEGNITNPQYIPERPTTQQLLGIAGEGRYPYSGYCKPGLSSEDRREMIELLATCGAEADQIRKIVGRPNEDIHEAVRKARIRFSMRGDF